MINYKKCADVLTYFCKSCINKTTQINKEPCKSCLNKGYAPGINYKPIHYIEVKIEK